MLHFFDFEVFRYDWMVVIINPVTESRHTIINDIAELTWYYKKYKDDIWLGYNVNGYDKYILAGILAGFNPFEVSQHIIVKKQKGNTFSKLLNNYPLITFDIGSRDKSLKQLEGFMGNDIRETEVPFDIDRYLTLEELASTEFYCTHDVEQAIEVFLQRKVEFDSQLALVKMFKMPLSYISKSQAQLASSILGAKRTKTDDDWDIRLPKTLQLNKYKCVADWFMNPENQNEKASLKIDIAGVPHIFAWGGVHGALNQFNYKCKDDEVLVMADVSQLYPYLMLVYRLLSRGCPDNAYDILKHTIETSIRLKAEGKKKEREPYKRFNNIIYGAMGDQYNAMYDPLHRTLVCVFGQVLILDLIEKVESFAKLIQSNTDGILLLIKKKDFERLDDAVYAWECRTGLTMTFDEYIAVYQGDVNNYVVIDAKGKYKSKGAYVKGLNQLDYDLPIVNEAIIKYITAGVPVSRTINECNELIKFQKVVRVSSLYFAGWHNNKMLKDKTFRVFASKNNNDGFIGKQKTEGSTIEKFANTPDHCFIDNTDIKGNVVPSNLDRNWYINLARTRLLDKFNIEENIYG